MVLFKMAASSSGRSSQIFERLCLDGEKDVDENHLLHYVRFLDEEKPLKDKETLTGLTHRLKSLLSSAEQKWIAICLLPNVMKNCDADTFQQNGIFWIRSLQQFLNSKPSIKLRDMALKSVSLMLSLSVEFDNMSREISLSVIHPLLSNLQAITKSNLQDSEQVINIFRQCILYYPGPSGRFRSHIENVCLQLLDSDVKPLQKAACRCLAVLPQCGSSGEKGLKFAEFWGKYTNLIFNTLGELWKDLNASSTNSRQHDFKMKTFRLQKITEVEPEHSKIVSRRICGLFCVFEEMMKKGFPNVVKLDLERVISLCCAFIDKDLKHDSTSIDVVCVNVVLPQIWCAVLSFLNVLIAQVTTLILPFENTILKIVLKILSVPKQHSNDSNNTKPFARLIVQSYVLLNTWCSRVNPILDDAISKLVTHALEDVKPITTRENSGAAPNGKGKTKKLTQGKKLQKELTKEEMQGKKLDRTVNSEITTAALMFLRGLISTSGPMLPVNLISSIQHSIISLCVCISENSVQVFDAFAAPYGSIQCRQEVYKCVFELFSLYHHQLPTPTSMMVNMLRMGLADPAKEVSTYCRQCLSLSDKIIRPSIPAFREYHEDSVPAERTRKSKTASFGSEGHTGLFGASNMASFVSLGGAEQDVTMEETDHPLEEEPGFSLETSHDDVLEPRSDAPQEPSKAHTENVSNRASLPMSANVGDASFEKVLEKNNVGELAPNTQNDDEEKSLAGKEIETVSIIENIPDDPKDIEDGNSATVLADQRDEQNPKRPRIEITDSVSDKAVTDLTDKANGGVQMEADISQQNDGQKKKDDANDVILIDSDNETDEIMKSFVVSLPDSD